MDKIRWEFIFSDNDRNILTSYGISDLVIKEIEDHLTDEYAYYFFEYHLTKPTSSEAKDTLKKLISSMNSLISQINQIHPLIETIPQLYDYNYDQTKKCVIEGLKELIKYYYYPVFSCINVKEDHTRLDPTLYEVIRDLTNILLPTGINITRRGEHFQTIVEIVFKTLGIKQQSARTVIDNSWESIIKHRIDSFNDFKKR